MVRNARVVFASVPKGSFKSTEVLRLEERTLNLDVPLNGGFLVKVLAVSLDPYMRNRMRPAGTPGDMPEFALDEPISGFAIGIVLRSEYSGVQAGQHIYGFMDYEEYVTFASPTSSDLGMHGLDVRVVSNPYGLPWHYFVGALGMSGQTAYFAMKDVLSPKSGETFYVSAGCGAVGHLAIQYAKALGLKVLASCGSERKCQIAQELGADYVFNWRTANIAAKLAENGPIDVYFDLVGGATLEAVINNTALHARIAICGMVSQYDVNEQSAYGIKNLWLLNKNRVKMEGFIVTDWHAKYDDQFWHEVPKKLASGDIKYITDIHRGLESVGSALEGMLHGTNIGKTVVILDESAL